MGTICHDWGNLGPLPTAYLFILHLFFPFPLCFLHWGSGLDYDYSSASLFPDSLPTRCNEWMLNRELSCSIRGVLIYACSAARPFIGSAEVESNKNESLSFKLTGDESRKPFPCMTDSARGLPRLISRQRAGTYGRIFRKGLSFGARPAWTPTQTLPLASCVTLVRKLLNFWASVSSPIREE